jgi:hypothetical protein
MLKPMTPFDPPSPVQALARVILDEWMHSLERYEPQTMEESCRRAKWLLDMLERYEGDRERYMAYLQQQIVDLINLLPPPPIVKAQVETVIGMLAAAHPDRPVTSWDLLRSVLADGCKSLDRRLQQFGPLEPERFGGSETKNR